MDTLNEKLHKLRDFIREKGKDGVVVAFSGGVDSSTLTAVAHQVLNNKLVAVSAKSPTYTSTELDDARQIAEAIGVKLFIVETNELDNPEFTKNPENRCYFCKKELLQTLVNFAHTIGFKVVFEGTNFSDLKDHRPGFQAVKEIADVYSPWMLYGFSKDEIRLVAKQLGLGVHDKPALACLASRIPFNQEITTEKLQRVEKAEEAIKALLPITQLRVRDHNGLARIEVPKSQRELLCNGEVLDKVAEALKALGFSFVTIDLEGFRSGSMLKTLKS